MHSCSMFHNVYLDTEIVLIPFVGAIFIDGAAIAPIRTTVY